LTARKRHGPPNLANSNGRLLVVGDDRPALLREVRRWDLLALVLNSIVGAGIFGLPSRVYALAGSYSLLAYLVCAVPVVLIILCFAEVGSRFKSTGGPYLYARTAFGPLIGFEVGWLMWLARVSAFAALCNLFVSYFSYLVPMASAPPWRPGCPSPETPAHRR